MPLYLSESDVDLLIQPQDAVDAIDSCFARMGEGQVEIRPRFRLTLERGALHVMAAADRQLGVGGFKAYVGFPTGARFVVGLFAYDQPELKVLVEASRLGQLRTGAASAVAARYLARPNATTLGIIGTGRQAETQVACIRSALPKIDRVVAYSRNQQRLADFCKRFGAEVADSGRQAAEQDIVVTITTSSKPVLVGKWLKPGTLVCAAGANQAGSRELDDEALLRASTVVCDLKEQASTEAADLIEPVERGVLAWHEIQELARVVSGDVVGRHSNDDIIVFKSVGIASQDIALAKFAFDRARARGVGREL